MTSEADFLHAILSGPDDEATRLVYADWLEERGDRRGDLVRAQMEWERVVREHPMLDNWHWETCRRSIFDGGDWGVSRSSWLVVERDLPWLMGADEEDTATRVRDLLAEHEEEWAGKVAPFVTAYEFRRGLLERVKVSLAGLREHAEELFRHAPVLELTITNETEEPVEGLAEVLALPALARLTHLHLTGRHWGEAKVARLLAGATNLKRLTSLWLEVVGIGDEGLALLANARHLRSLSELHLEYNGIGLPGMRALASSPHLTRLRHLYLGGNDLSHVYRHGSKESGAESVGALASWPGLKRLKTLDLGGNYIRAAGMAALAASPHRPRLTTLLLDGNDLGREGIEALAGSRLLDSVERLELSSNSLHADAMPPLVRALRRNTLRHLALGHNYIGDEGLAALARCSRLEELNALKLCNDHFGPEGISALFSSEHLYNLHWLDLSCCDLEAEAMRALAGCGTSILQHLDLSDNPLGDEGVEALADWAGLAYLWALWLVETEMGDRGARALAASPHLGFLIHLDVSFNGLSKKANAALVKRWGKEIVCAD